MSSLVQNYAEHSAFPTSLTNSTKQKAARRPERLNGVIMTLSFPSLSVLAAQADLNQLVSRHTPSVRTSGNVTHYRCPNPAHEDRNPSFTVTTTRQGKQLARCLSQCAWYGDAIEFLKWIEGLSTHEAAVQLRNQFGQHRQSSFEPTRTIPSKNVLSLLPKVHNTSEKLNTPEAKAFLSSYLRSRHWPQSVTETFQLHVVRDSKNEMRVRHSFYVPHENGEWVVGYWQDRGRKTALPKWLSPRQSTPTLFNLKSLQNPKLEAVVICEGAADAITASLALEGCNLVGVVGVPGASAWQPKWAELFRGLRVVIAADNDEAGQQLEQQISRSLSTPPAYFRPKCNDLTETAKEIGLDALRELLVDLLGTQPEPPQATNRDITLLEEFFPHGFIVEGTQ